MCTWTSVWGLFLLATVGLASKEVLTEDDFKEDFIRSILQLAIRGCNVYDNGPSWNKLEAIVDGTKRPRVDKTVVYTFKLRQKATNCPKEAILSNHSKQPETSCATKFDANLILCTVRVHMKVDKEQKPEVTVDSLWYQYPVAHVSTVTHRLTSVEPQAGLYEKRQQIYGDYTVAHNTDELVNYAGFDEANEEQENFGDTRSRTYSLNETQCSSSTKAAENDTSKDYKCFGGLLGYVVDCQPLGSYDHQSDSRLRNCNVNNTALSSMWRYSMRRPHASHKCLLSVDNGKNPPLDEGGTNLTFHAMHNFGRSNIRALDADELEQSPFREIIRDSVIEYNKRVNDAYMYSLQSVENVKEEIEPKRVLTFSMIVQLTNCRKTDELLENVAKFQDECRELLQPLTLQLCHVTVTGEFGTENDDRSFSFQACRATEPRNRMVGDVRRMDQQERESDDFKQLIERVVSQYNNQSKSELMYALEDVRNAAIQVVSGKRITMNLTMKSLGCKEMLNCLPRTEESYMHCEVTVIQQPWISLEMINVTNCWQRDKILRTIKGIWDTPSLEYLNLPETQKMFAATVTYHNQLFNESNITTLDYVSGFRKLEGDGKRLYTFTIHLKGIPRDEVLRKCEVIYMEPLLRDVRLVVKNCTEEKRTPARIFVGKPRILTDNERDTEEFHELTERVYSKFNQLANYTHYHRLLRIVNATVQVVAGKLTVLHIHLQQTGCRKEHDDKLFEAGLYHECGVPNQTHVTSCRVRVWNKPWENFEEITLEECQTTKLKTPIYVQEKAHDLRALTYFKQLVKRVEDVFNLESDEPVFFETHLVEKIEFKQSEDREYKFVHMFKPTQCVKWTDAIYFQTGQTALCKGRSLKTMVTCETSVKVKGKPKNQEEVILASCESFQLGHLRPRRAMTNSERVSTEFAAIKDRAVNIFNTKTHSANWHTLFTVERPTIEYIAGKEITFTLFMLPTLCRPSVPMREKKKNESTICNDTILRYTISCNVRYWVRPWSKEHETIDVKDCVIIPVENISLAKAPINERLHENHRVIQCLQSLLPNLLDTFSRQRGLSLDYDSTLMDNIERQAVAGNRFTFDLFFRHKLDSTKCSTKNNLTRKCLKKISFYHCKASIWSRPWQDLVVYELLNCLRIVAKINVLPSETTILPGSDVEDELQEVIQRATKLYNDVSFGDVIYGFAEANNVTHQLHFGIKTTFSLKMIPSACRLEIPKDDCYSKESEPYVQCLVTYWQRPWMLGIERLSLDECRQRYGSEKTPGIHPLSQQERSSAKFQQLLAKLVDLYKPTVPILYAVDELEGAKVHLTEHVRNVTFSLNLKPIGCNHSLPNAEDPACKNWQKEDAVRCDAQIVETMPFGGSMQLYLKNCQARWEAHPRRALTSEDLLELWFQKSLATAWNIYGKINPENNLYTISRVDEATTERGEEEITLYSIEFTRTECLKGADEHKFSYGATKDCHLSTPTTKATCSVKSTRHTDGRQSVSLNCGMPHSTKDQ